ncbi:uncharacterized protein LOC134691657 [Mytilus trossulus]|uniref:uncharacterized protein LOC134691657 n=1 Tax=Mytilus trossulus TaxID=6551 RepID=UPI003004B771
MAMLMAFKTCIVLTVWTSFQLCVNGNIKNGTVQTTKRANTTQFVYIQGEKGSENWKLICKMHQNPKKEQDICKRKEETKLQSSFNAMYSNFAKECFKTKSEHNMFSRTKMAVIRNKVFGGECTVFDDEFIIERIMGEIQTEDIDEKSKSRETAFDVFTTGTLKNFIHICPDVSGENITRRPKISVKAQAVLAVCSSYIKRLITLSYACNNNNITSVLYRNVSLVNDSVSLLNVSMYQYINQSTPEWKKEENKICPKLKPSSYGVFMVIVEVFFNIDTLYQSFMVLSMISLFIVLLVYSCFKQLRNISGLNNMFLAGNMMLAYFFWFFHTLHFLESHLWCSVSGMFKHFSLLNVALWIHVCIGHMFRVFWLFRPNTGVYFKRQSVIWYAVFVKVIAIVCVVINISLSKHQQFTNGKIDRLKTVNLTEIFISGYGGHACFMYDPNMVKWLYRVPVVAISCINVSLLVLVWIRTRWNPILQTNTSTNRRMVIFYAIMTAVMLLKQCVGYFSKVTDQIFIFHIIMFLESTYGMIFLVVFVTSTEIRWLPAYWKLTHRTRHSTNTLVETNLPPYDIEDKYKTL